MIGYHFLKLSWMPDGLITKNFGGCCLMLLIFRSVRRPTGSGFHRRVSLPAAKIWTASFYDSCTKLLSKLLSANNRISDFDNWFCMLIDNDVPTFVLCQRIYLHEYDTLFQEVSGLINNEEQLDYIFSKFCMGRKCFSTSRLKW